MTKALKTPIGSCFPVHSSCAIAASCVLYNRTEQVKPSLFVMKHEILQCENTSNSTALNFDLSINQLINKVKLEAR